MSKYERARQEIAERRAAAEEQKRKQREEELAKRLATGQERLNHERLQKERLNKFREAQPKITEILHRANKEILQGKGKIEDWQKTTSGIHWHKCRIFEDRLWEDSSYNHESVQIETRLIIPDKGIVGLALPICSKVGILEETEDPELLVLVSNKNPKKRLCYIDPKDSHLTRIYHDEVKRTYFSLDYPNLDVATDDLEDAILKEVINSVS